MNDDTVIQLDGKLAEVSRKLGDDPAGGTAEIESIAVDPQGRRVAVGLPGRVLVYAATDSTLLEEYSLVDVMAHVPARLLLMADGTHVIAQTVQQVSNRDTVQFVLVLGDKKKKPLLAVPSAKALSALDPAEAGSGVQAWAVSSTGARLATAWEPHGVAVWNLATRRRERLILKGRAEDEDAEPVEASALAFSPDGERLAILRAGALEVHPCGRGRRVARIELDETFGTSRIAFTPDGIVWARCAPGVCETSVIEIESATVARRPVGLEHVEPMRIDATSVLWLQTRGEGAQREQILVRQDHVTGQLDPVARTPAPPDAPSSRVHLALSASGDRIARIEGRSVRVASLG